MNDKHERWKAIASSRQGEQAEGDERARYVASRDRIREAAEALGMTGLVEAWDETYSPEGRGFLHGEWVSLDEMFTTDRSRPTER